MARRLHPTWRGPILVSAALFAPLLGGCSSSTNGSNGSGAGAQFAAQACTKFAGCNVSVANCNAVFAAIVLSQSCESTLLNASCADLGASPVPAALAACFPACSGMTSKCNPDETITVCSGTNQYEYTCSGICASTSTTFTGTCGTSYNGQASSNGQPKCWCQ